MSDETPRLVWAHNGYLTSEAHRAAKRRLAVGAAWPIEVRTLVLAFGGPVNLFWPRNKWWHVEIRCSRRLTRREVRELRSLLSAGPYTLIGDIGQDGAIGRWDEHWPDEYDTARLMTILRSLPDGRLRVAVEQEDGTPGAWSEWSCGWRAVQP